MAELGPGEKSWEKMLKPGVGSYSISAIRSHLRMSGSAVRALCKRAGVELVPFVRDESAVKKTYKRGYRWLTEDEARRVLEAHWSTKRSGW